ncbi:hypothetical protein B2A_14480, partial [mine drainage metagenome]
STGSLAWSVPNGSYPFRIQDVPGWATTQYAGSFTVNGSSLSATVTWNRVTYPVVVHVQGIPNGTPWTLLVNGQPFRSTTTTLTLELPNGSYTLGIVAPPGYQLRTPPGNLTLSGVAPSAPVVVELIPSPAAPAPPVGLEAAVAGGLAAGAGLLAWGIVRRRRPRGGAGR